MMRDHLGYRYELQRMRVQQAAGAISIELDIINRGFDVIHRRCRVEVLLLHPSNGTIAA